MFNKSFIIMLFVVVFGFFVFVVLFQRFAISVYSSSWRQVRASEVALRGPATGAAVALGKSIGEPNSLSAVEKKAIYDLGFAAGLLKGRQECY